MLDLIVKNMTKEISRRVEGDLENLSLFGDTNHDGNLTNSPITTQELTNMAETFRPSSHYQYDWLLFNRFMTVRRPKDVINYKGC